MCEGLRPLPCPACGGENIYVNPEGAQTFCVCPACGLRGPYIRSHRVLVGADVIAAWNLLPRQQGIDDALALAAMRHYGLENRLNQMQEELAEAMAAINHWRRGRSGAREELAEELADVLVVMEQLRVELGPEIERWVAEKKERLSKHAWFAEVQHG